MKEVVTTLHILKMLRQDISRFVIICLKNIFSYVLNFHYFLDKYILYYYSTLV